MSENDSRPIEPQLPGQVPAVTPDRGGAIGTPLPAAPWVDTTESKEGFNLTGFLHSLRRRWLAGLGFGLIAAAVVGIILYMLVPIKFEAFVTIRVRRNPDEILRDAYSKRTVHPQDFEIEKQTQAALLKSPFVIHAALREPGISQLPLVRDNRWFGKRKNEVAWLERELKVEYAEGSEILRMSMTEERPEELKKLLNAVTDAFMVEIVQAEAADRMVKLQKLRDSYREEMKDINRRLKKVSELAKTFGSTRSESVKLQLDMGFRQLAALDRERMGIDNQFFEAYDIMTLQQHRINAAASYEPRDFEIEDVLQSQYPEYAMMKTQLIEMENMMKLRGGGRAGGGMQAQVSALRSNMDEFKYQRRNEVIERLRRMSDNDDQRHQEDLTMMQTRLRNIQQRRAKVYQDYKVVSDRLASMGQYSAELEAEQMAIRSQEEFLGEVKREMEKLELEVASRPQIRVLQRALIPNEYGSSIKILKYMQVIAASMMTMFITMLGVALWDMQGMRVNTSKEVADSGDVRVVGSLPTLNGRRAGGLLPMTETSKRLIEVGLTRSIDSIRAALQFTNASRPYNLVMITSALGQEGKTTVASQLAVSFARAGRRTLLIDADFRNPQQHTVLGMQFQRGLCDLLRSDATLDDVVQPSPAEGLWLMCAGHRDANTDQALSSSMMNTIFSELRSQFDIVIIDAGPVLTCPDAMLIGQHVDTTVLSIRRDSSRIPKVNEACNRLRTVGIHIAGSVLNGVAMDVRESELQLTNAPSGNDPQLEQTV